MGTIHVNSEFGNDSWDGRPSKPKATMMGALSVAAAGDIIYLRSDHCEIGGRPHPMLSEKALRRRERKYRKANKTVA